MAISQHKLSAHVQSIDWLFTHQSRECLGNTLPAQSLSVSNLPNEWPKPAPGNAERDVQAAQEWLRAEKQRLDEYTRYQFAVIRQQHQALLTEQYRNETALALREQDLNREMAFVAAQTETLQQRARDLAERERALAAQMQKLAGAQAELLAIQQTSANVCQDTEAQQVLLQQWRSETAQLQALDGAARARFDAFEEELKERQKNWEARQAELAARQAQLEKRFQSLEQTEAATNGRLEELSELEERLREEVEEQERRLTRERRALEHLETRLRSEFQRSELHVTEGWDDD